MAPAKGIRLSLDAPTLWGVEDTTDEFAVADALALEAAITWDESDYDAFTNETFEACMRSSFVKRVKQAKDDLAVAEMHEDGLTIDAMKRSPFYRRVQEAHYIF